MSTQRIERWELDWTFGDRLRKARRVVGVTVEQMAQTVGVSKAAVNQWETGATTPRSVNAVARRIELAYGIPAAWLLGQESPQPAGPDGGQVVELRQRRTREAPPTGLEPVTLWFHGTPSETPVAA